MDNRNYKKMFVITLLIVIVLVVVLAYFMLVKPRLQGYVVDKQIEGRDLTILALLQQIQQNGYAQIVVGNQTLVLVPYDPNAQQPQMAG